jgi:hypothetical protein
MAVGPSDPDDFLETVAGSVEDSVIRMSNWVGRVSDYLSQQSKTT